MDITTELDQMRADIPGCALVAFTDLTSKLVLSTSAPTNPAQEEMNALSSAAQLALDGAIAEGASAVWGQEPAAEVAMLLTGADARVFLRSPGKAGEALICVCSPDANLEGAVSRARVTLERIAEGS